MNLGRVTTLCALAGSAACSPGRTDGPGDGAACVFEVTSSLSERIASVGIVEWSLSDREPERAHIEFGLDTSYGLSAPVDLAESRYRTLLLGMKASREYHFRIVADECVSEDHTLTTGPAPNGLPSLTVTTTPGAVTDDGFLVSCLLFSPVFILDADGDYVWWYGSGEMGRAALSRDRKHLWYSGINVAGVAGSMKRVTLDGLVEEDFTQEFAGIHHDFTILPDETVAFIQTDGGSDRIMERSSGGELTEVLDVAAAHGGPDTHANSIHYWPELDAYTLSDLAQNAYVYAGRGGSASWVLGGSTSDFSGDGASWNAQHGHELVAPDRLLFFNNGSGDDVSSLGVEVALDFERGVATRVWEYGAGVRSAIFGDVARLPSGNTRITFSTAGTIHEVTKEGALVRSLDWALGAAPGYVTQYDSLYAEPAL